MKANKKPTSTADERVEMSIVRLSSIRCCEHETEGLCRACVETFAEEVRDAEREAIAEECNETAAIAKRLQDRSEIASTKQYHVGRKDAALMLAEFIKERGAR